MTGSIITDYLSEQRRLTIPGLGTFIRRPEGTVAFTRLLTDDESILAGTVARAQNIPSEKAREEIRKFVDTVRTATAAGRRYPVSGLGWFYSDPQGIVRFRYDPAAQEPQIGNDAQERITESSGQNRTVQGAAQPTTTVSGQSPNTPRPPTAATSAAPRTQSVTAGGQTQNSARQPAAYEAAARPAESAVHPSPATGPGATMQSAAPDEAVRPMNIRRPGKRHKVDRTIIAAIVALLIALGVLLYGYIAKPAPDLNLQDTEQVEPEVGEAAQP